MTIVGDDPYQHLSQSGTVRELWDDPDLKVMDRLSNAVHRRALARAPAVCQRAGRDRSLAWLRPALRLIGLQLALGAGCPREGVERDPVALGCLHRSLHAFGPLDPQAGSL